MSRGAVSGGMLTLLSISVFTLAFSIQTVKAEANSIRGQDASAPLIYVLVHGSVYDDVKFHIDRYISDVERLGFNATVLPISGISPEEVRALLMNALSDGLVGCLLVGDVPWALYEMDDPDPNIGHEEFPIDLFYMDLNGVWTDTDGDGIYDEHTGDRIPEIWVGRIKASNMAESEVSLIQNYFDKNHDYRTGTLSLPNRALIYIDDDWAYGSSADYTNVLDYAVSLLYTNRTIINDNATTRPSDYLDRLNQSWSFVHLMVHGEADLHYFMTNGEWIGNVASSDIRSIDPPAFFYILFSCTNAKYNEPDYIAGWYIFSDTYGVAAISSTKTGGMVWSSDFYSNFNQYILGFSFQDWLAKRVITEDADPSFWYNKHWYYGMTILGDPTLSAKPEIGNIAITSVSTYKTVLFSNTTNPVNVTAENLDAYIETFNVTLYCNETQIGTQIVTLSPLQSTVLTFEWNTTGFECGDYILEAYAHPVPTEMDTTDNTFTYSIVLANLVGDLNGDQKVDILDVGIMAAVWMSKPGDPNWNAIADLNGDDIVNILDVGILAGEWGKTT